MSSCESRFAPSAFLIRSIGALLAAAPLAAGAQGAPASGASERALEEVVVTANRREERLQDVGL